MAANQAYWLAAQAMGDGGAPVAMGGAGQGKTQQFYAFCRAVGRKPYVLIPSMRDATDFYGAPFSGEVEIGVNGGSRKTTVMRIANPEWAVQTWNGDKWAILLDEMTTAVPIIQSCLLRIIAERHVGEIPLPKDTWILGAANPPELAPNGCEFSPPLANRLYHHAWEVDRDAVLRGYMAGLDFAPPEIDTLPDDWEKYIGGMGGLVAAFHKHLPGRLDMQPEDVAEQAKAWPSQRTWEYAIRCLAAAESIEGSKALQHILVSGLVGEAVAREFTQWRENLDLPDPEALIKAAELELEGQGTMIYEHPNRPDKVMAMLASVTAAVAQDTNPKRWEAAMLVLQKSADHALDVTLASAKPLVALKRNLPAGSVRLDADFVARVFPKIQTALGL